MNVIRAIREAVDTALFAVVFFVWMRLMEDEDARQAD